ncbi:MAG: S8 family serine peptidase [Bacteroidota bacterium]
MELVKWCICLLVIGGAFSSLSAQESQLAWVYFTDKAEGEFRAEAYFDSAALARKTRLGLPESDSLDWPVSEQYLAAVADEVQEVRHRSRWLNAVSVEASPAALNQIADWKFVRAVVPFAWAGEVASNGTSREVPGGPTEGRVRSEAEDGATANSERDRPQTATLSGWGLAQRGEVRGQKAEVRELMSVKKPRFDTLLSLTRNLMELDQLAAAGLNGKGMRIAILDAGFLEADTHPALAEVRARGGILRTWDFYQGDSGVYHHSHHGMEVMSCIAGKYQGKDLGGAPEAEFLLARIEHRRREKAIEEDHWVAAAEWADRHGADLINSSVTYTFKRYTYSDMDGNTAPVSRAARIATQKGILVVASMGNEGKKKWQYLGAPADAPEVLSVGGSLPVWPQRNPFSSLGPNANRHPKPDVAAPGFVLTAKGKGTYDENAGTSFAAPLITGLAACYLQQQPETLPTELAQRIREMGHFYPYYDYALGWGVPKVSRWLVDSLPEIAPTFRVGFKGDSVILALDTLHMQDSVRFPYGHLLYFHLDGGAEGLLAYETIRLPNDAKYYFFLRRRQQGILRIWLDGFLWERG